MWRREDVLKQLKEKQEAHGSLRSYASNIGCSAAYVSQVLNGHKEPSQKLLDELGLEREIVTTVNYKPKSKTRRWK